MRSVPSPLTVALLALAVAGCGQPLDTSDPGKQSQMARSIGGLVMLSAEPSDWTCPRQYCGGFFPALLSNAVRSSQSGGRGILAIGVHGGYVRETLDSWNDPRNGGPGAPLTIVNSAATIAEIDLSRYAVLYLPSSRDACGIGETQLRALAGRRREIAAFVNQRGGSLIALDESRLGALAWRWLPLSLTTARRASVVVEATSELEVIAPGVDSDNFVRMSSPSVFTGPAGFSGMRALAVTRHGREPVMIGGLRVVLTAELCTDGRDNDGDGLIDGADSDCQVCGDGDIDPGEACDDGNHVSGDGCSACRLDNTPPATDAGDDATVDEGSAFRGSGSFADPDDDSWTATVDYGDGSAVQPLALDGQRFTLEHTYSDDGSYRVTVTVTDSQGAKDSDSLTVTVRNVAPTVGAVDGPNDAVQTGTSITVSAGFTDPGTDDTHSATWQWGDGSSSSGTLTVGDATARVSGSHSYAAAGVYAVKLTVTDDDGATATALYESVLVYAPASDPTSGPTSGPASVFAQGSGWIDSPAGADADAPTASGTARFRFTAQPGSGGTGPIGSVQFQTRTLALHSKGYDWLIDTGSRVLLHGSGTVDRTSGYSYLLSASDSAGGDALRLQIWETASGRLIYDNQRGDQRFAAPTARLTSGSITIRRR